MNPSIAVMILGGWFKPRLIRLAVRAGFHMVANDGDIEALAALVTTRRDPTVVFL